MPREVYQYDTLSHFDTTYGFWERIYRAGMILAAYSKVTINGTMYNSLTVL